MLSYIQAARHAANCGILGANMLALPISEEEMTMPSSVQIGQAPIDPETLRELGRVGDIVSREQLIKLARDYGLDYVVIRV